MQKATIRVIAAFLCFQQVNYFARGDLGHSILICPKGSDSSPLLMAHDTHFGGELWQPISPEAAPSLRSPEGIESVRMEADGMTLLDFASAGGNDPENDLYTVFIPTSPDSASAEK